MGILKFSSFCLLLLVLLVPNVFGSGFAYDGLGVKARGMGGAFRAIADDWSAAYYNPAGYNWIADNLLTGNLDVFHNRYTFTPNVTRDGIDETGFYNGQELYNDHAILNVPQGGIVFRLPDFGLPVLGDETVFGFSIMQTFDQNQSWELFNNIPAYSEGDFPSKEFYNNLDVVNFQFTAARGFMEDRMSIGIGLSVLRADLMYRDIVLRDNPFLNDPIFYDLAERPADKVPEYYGNDGRGFGFGYKLGMMYKVNEKMKFGLVYNGKSSIDITGDSHIRMYMSDNPALAGTLSDRGVQQTSEEYYFVSGRVRDITAEFETTLDIPASIGVGLSYQLSEKLLVAVDAEMVFWSQFEGFYFDFMNFQGMPDSSFENLTTMIETDMNVPIDWDNAGRLMIGAAYQAENWVQLRCGFSYDQTVVKDDTMIPQFMDLVNQMSLTAGAGFDINYWRLELAGVFTHYGDVTVGNSSDIDGDGLMDNITGDYKANVFRTILGITYRF